MSPHAVDCGVGGDWDVALSGGLRVFEAPAVCLAKTRQARHHSDRITCPISRSRKNKVSENDENKDWNKRLAANSGGVCKAGSNRYKRNWISISNLRGPELHDVYYPNSYMSRSENFQGPAKE